MIRRLILGLVVGFLVGGAIAAGVVRLIGLSFLVSGGVLFAYLSAAAVGAGTGLVAGKPFWAHGAKVETGLKAAFGALMGVGAMFALRRWSIEIPSPAVLGGARPIGDLPAIALPLIAAGLGGLFGLDNSPASAEAPAARTRVETGSAKESSRPGQSRDGARGSDADDADGAALTSKRAKS
ncbi:MAG: hypothetical protein ACREJ3_14460 [Polyangiaceae bacterium]